MAVTLGTGVGYSVLERVRAFEKACGKPVPYRVGPRRAGDIASCYADPAQALALLGAAPRFDSFGRLAGATLKPLAELGRPRIDVVVTKNSGGELTRPKLVAAQALGVDVVMIGRPPLPAGVTVVDSVDDAVGWLLSRGSAAG